MLGAHYSGLSNLASPFLAGCGAILMLHRVGKQQNQSGLNGFLSVEEGFLREMLSTLKRSGLIFVSLDEAVDRIKHGHTDERFAAITLDDGYRDNLLNAAPIFKALETPYTIFACTGFADATASLWWEIVAKIIEGQDQLMLPSKDGEQRFRCRTSYEKQCTYDVLIDYLIAEVSEAEQRQIVTALASKFEIDEAAYCRNEAMNWGELKLAAQDPLCTIGAHTLNHFALKRLSAEHALSECVQSAEILADHLGEKPRHFAYPYGGDYAVGQRETEIARAAGFASAVTTRHGMLLPEHKSHLFALPRISINGNYQRIHYVKTMLTGFTVPVANRGKRLVTV